MWSEIWHNPSGGVRYHMRAALHGQAWQPFRRELSAWLSRWQPERSTLAIVGPSAGHCLPLEALQSFERLIIFEIDPLARWLLKRRLARGLPGRSVTWITDDRWIDPVRHGRELPERLIGTNGAVLFSNIIGQVPYLLEPGEYPDWSKAWRERVFPWLEHTPWASFHDRVSGGVPPFAALPTHRRQLSDLEVSALYEGAAVDGVLELNDHRSQDLLPAGYEYAYLHWPLANREHHLIECALGGPCGV
jgi:hypothetical protein